MNKAEFDNNIHLQRRLTELITDAVRRINTEPALTAEQKASLIKQLGGAPKHLLFEYLNTTFRSGPDIAKSIKDLIREDRPRGGPKKTDTTTKAVLKKVKKINTPKKSKYLK